ncbi:UDP-3-O-N-acetylglucosamine deacetylase [Corynascus novoguineensis]|uniref:UDP-3-O-N-acetylglucosamine deacetylase n=1 Tax=Corynascus novoguineensis TaxID=1126955 RepID=A0AAN7CMG9_9PEZI|nr:UDP-3-O-N-acetylglucosamine deacetylase [Corynascus novoguineensis]
MRFHALFGSLLLQILFGHTVAEGGIRSIYLFKDVMKSNTTALKTSGFNTLIIFGVGVLNNGDIMYYSNTPGSTDVLIASNGSYTGGDALAERVRSFKDDADTATTVDRVEISMNSQNIRQLMSSGGDAASPLYRNFAALRDAWALDAVNNDDESIYDGASTVSFARMLGDIGYRYTIAPYDAGAASFWKRVVDGANANREELLLDRVYLQLYDGGAYNNPGGWQDYLGMKVVPLLWVINDSKPQFGQSPAQARSRFAQWSSQDGVAGGGYWNDFDIEKMGSSYTEYGAVLKEIFP